MNGPCRMQLSPGHNLDMKTGIPFSWAVDCFHLQHIKKGTNQIYHNLDFPWVPQSLVRKFPSAILSWAKWQLHVKAVFHVPPTQGVSGTIQKVHLAHFRVILKQRNFFRSYKGSDLTSLDSDVLGPSEILKLLRGLMVKASSWKTYKMWTKHVWALYSTRRAHWAKHRLPIQSQNRKCWYFGKSVIYTQKLG